MRNVAPAGHIANDERRLLPTLLGKLNATCRPASETSKFFWIQCNNTRLTDVQQSALNAHGTGTSILRASDYEGRHIGRANTPDGRATSADQRRGS